MDITMPIHVLCSITTTAMQTDYISSNTDYYRN